jgi:hypothetical protein
MSGWMASLRAASAYVATADPHRRSLVFAIAATVFVLMAGGLVLMEVLTRWSARADHGRKSAGHSPRTGYLGLVSSVLAGPSPKVFKKRALMLMAVSEIIALVALMV